MRGFQGCLYAVTQVMKFRICDIVYIGTGRASDGAASVQRGHLYNLSTMLLASQGLKSHVKSGLNGWLNTRSMGTSK